MATKEQEITQIGHSVTIKGDISGNSDVRVAGNVIGGTMQCYADSTGKSIYFIYDDGEVIASA